MLQADRPRLRPGRCFRLLVVAIVLIAGVGCARDAPITIASHVWVGYEPMFLARSLGWLDEGRVTLHETASASESMEALVAGRVDGAAREPPARRSAALDHLGAEHLLRSNTFIATPAMRRFGWACAWNLRPTRCSRHFAACYMDRIT